VGVLNEEIDNIIEQGNVEQHINQPKLINDISLMKMYFSFIQVTDPTWLLFM